MITLIFLLLIIASVTVFSVQNAVPVTISLFVWRFEASLAIVVFLSVVSGILIGTGLIYLSRAKRYLKNRDTLSKDGLPKKELND